LSSIIFELTTIRAAATDLLFGRFVGSRRGGGDKSSCSIKDGTITCTTAETAFETFLNFMFCWIGIIADESIESHDKTGGTKAALTAVQLCDSLRIRVEDGEWKTDLLHRMRVLA